MNVKIDTTDEKIEDVHKRMDTRLNKLEAEMKKSEEIRRKSLELRRKSLEDPNRNNDKPVENVINNPKEVEEKERRDFLPANNTEQDQLEKRKEKVKEVTDTILQEPVGTFRSSWALGIQEELRKAAIGRNREEDGRRTQKQVEPDHPASWQQEESYQHAEEIPDTWEDRSQSPFQKQKPQAKTKVRRPPPVITKWFGSDSTSEEEDESGEEESWIGIDRKKKNEEKRRKAARRKEMKKREVATKAAHMASLGPISIQSVQYFQQDGTSFEDAKKLAVREFLQYNMGYSDSDLEEVHILETRLSAKSDDFINVALATEDEIRELYVRKAETKNEDITIRCYIPPNFHQRFMKLNSIYTEKRAENPNLKTQLRFSCKDIDVYIKMKNEDSGFRKVEIREFTTEEIPEFEHGLKWKRYADRPPRVRSSQMEKPKARPSTLGQQWRKQNEPEKPSNQNPLIRTHSIPTRTSSKKPRLNASSSGGEISDMDQSNTSSSNKICQASDNV